MKIDYFDIIKLIIGIPYIVLVLLIKYNKINIDFYELTIYFLFIGCLILQKQVVFYKDK